ncbi:MAG: histidinol-phosphate transaminase [Boseongicola sp. SB0670_bin_30]|nr:histidinol-phosphate transaminase [Boseongicola sp. SB0670_bin_30]
MTRTPVPKSGIDRIALYQGGESHLEGRSDVLKLSSNENPFGTPGTARAAWSEVAGELHRYPAADHSGLRHAIAEVHGLKPGLVICGAGSDEVISFLCQAYGGEGAEVIHTEHGFSMYRISAMASGAVPVEVPEVERRVTVDCILDGVTDRTRLVFVANPANPTGTMIDASEVSRLAEALPSQVLLVLDGAYAEYVEGFDGGAALVEARENVVMTRTFSKIYGLGGLRVGWGYGPAHVIDNLNRVRGPFNLSTVQLAVAEAAARDRNWVRRCLKENAARREWLSRSLAEVGVLADPSSANFILARFRDEVEANSCDAALREDGILVRQVRGYKLPNCLRITVGSESDCRRVVESVRRFREEQT